MSVRILGAFPRRLCGLLVGIRPVVNLFLDKLTSGDGTERCPGEVKISIRAQWHQAFIVHLTSLQFADVIGILGDNLPNFLGPLQGRVFLVVEVLGIFAPCSVVVFIQDDAVPINSLNPLVSSLNTAGVILTQNILKRGEADERFALVYVVEFAVFLLLAELPSFKVLMGKQVFFPGGLHRRLEG